MTTFNVSVAAADEDGYEYPIGTSRADIWFGHYGTSDEIAYFHLKNITIAKDATITSATLTLTEKSDEGGTYTVNAKVRAQLIADATKPSSINLPSNMTPTTAGVDLDVSSANWTADETTAVTITSVIQELVNQAGWVSGNDINILIYNDGTTGNQDLEVYNYESSAAKAAALSVEYTTGAASAISKVNGVAWASVSKVNGVAKASIAKINGISI